MNPWSWSLSSETDLGTRCHCRLSRTPLSLVARPRRLGSNRAPQWYILISVWQTQSEKFASCLSLWQESPKSTVSNMTIVINARHDFKFGYRTILWCLCEHTTVLWCDMIGLAYQIESRRLCDFKLSTGRLLVGSPKYLEYYAITSIRTVNDLNQFQFWVGSWQSLHRYDITN